jgi:hypothetical protein
MSPKLPQLKSKQLDTIDKALRAVWVLAIGGALLLAAFAYFLDLNTPPPLGQAPSHQSARSTR